MVAQNLEELALWLHEAINGADFQRRYKFMQIIGVKEGAAQVELAYEASRAWHFQQAFMIVLGAIENSKDALSSWTTKGLTGKVESLDELHLILHAAVNGAYFHSMNVTPKRIIRCRHFEQAFEMVADAIEEDDTCLRTWRNTLV